MRFHQLWTEKVEKDIPQPLKLQNDLGPKMSEKLVPKKQIRHLIGIVNFKMTHLSKWQKCLKGIQNPKLYNFREKNKMYHGTTDVSLFIAPYNDLYYCFYWLFVVEAAGVEPASENIPH